MKSQHFRLAGFLSLSVLVATGCDDVATPRDAGAAPPDQAQQIVPLPNKDGSFKFAVLGDFGNATPEEYQTAAQMVRIHDKFKFDFVAMVGDNLYGSERPQDFEKKFETPYKPLIDAGVKFYGALGNHDAREQRYYKLFNMDGNLYYSVKPKNDIRFFFLESTYPVPEQIKWVETELKNSDSDWKIAVFHHPLYSSGERHGSDIRLREVLEPLFLQYNVSVVLNGHDHFYERIKPQKGIQYFVVGSGGELRKGNIDRGSGLTASGFDSDNAFMVAEIVGDEMYFNAISRTGNIVDSGVLTRRKIAR
jgi:hypothetical protein